LGVVRLVRPDDGKEIVRLAGPEAKSYFPMCLTRDGTRLIAGPADSSELYVWDLRLIRKQLQELHMDWELPEFAPAAPSRAVALAVDHGWLRQPVFETPRHDVAAYSVLLALQPINPDACFHRGFGYVRLRKWRRALTDFEMFLALAPNSDLRRPE